MSRSLRVREDCIEATKQTLKRCGYRSQRALAEEFDYALATVNSFLNGKAVDFSTFIELCSALSIHWQDIADLGIDQPDLTSGRTAAAKFSSSPVPGAAQHPRQQDWGDSPDASQFYGRETELSILKDWVLHQRCRLIAILGMGGIGKTSLAGKLAEQIQDEFDYLIWKSLRNSPPIQEILADLILFLSNKQKETLPEKLDGQIYAVIDYLRQSRCLIVLDNAESVMQSSHHDSEPPLAAGSYLPGYEGYGQLLRCVSETVHQSCLLLTSREKPRGLAVRETLSSPLRSLQLQGLVAPVTQNLLADKGIILCEASLTYLNTYYSGNPLALKIVATTIQELFGGDVDQFLKLNPSIFGDISDLLAQHFDRLSEPEKQVMYQLAVNLDWVSMADLHQDLVPPPSYADLLNTLESLNRRSLIEVQSARFNLQPVVAEYTRDRLITELLTEIITTDLHWFRRQPIIKAQADDYLRQAQVRILLSPLAEKLLHQLGTQAEISHCLKGVLAQLRRDPPGQPGYGGGNVFNLIWQLQLDMSQFDFSGLAVWQAHLPSALLQNVNFTRADLSRSSFAHTLGTVFTAALSPDESLVAVSLDNAVALWRVTDGKPTMVLKGHTGWVVSVAFCPNQVNASTEAGEPLLLATGSHDHTVRLWDIATGQCINTLRGHRSWIQVVTFSADGRYLASGANDNAIRLWEVSTGRCVQVLQGHGGKVLWVAFTPDGQFLISAGADQTVRRWQVNTGDCHDSWDIAINWMLSIALSPDGKTLATGSNGKSVRLWDLSTGSCLQLLPYNAFVWSLAYSPDGQQLITAAEDGTVRLWDVLTGNCIKILPDHHQRVWLVGLGDRGYHLVTTGDDLTLRLWNLETGRCLKSIKAYSNTVYALALVPSRKLLVSSHEDNLIRFWPLAQERTFSPLKAHSKLVTAIAFNPSGNLLATGSDDHTLKLWDVDTVTCLRTFSGHTGWVTSVAFDPIHGVLASSSHDRSVRLWDTETGECLAVLDGHIQRVRQVVFHPQGIWLASASDDQTILLWDRSDGTIDRPLQGHSAEVTTVDFSPDGRVLCSGSDDGCVKFWDIETGECQQTLAVSKRRIRKVVFSPDGHFLAGAGDEGSIYLWDSATCEVIQIFKAHEKPIRALVFNQDGSTLFSGGNDGAIKQWQVPGGPCDRTLLAAGPYEGMRIAGVTGLSTAEKHTLLALGAIEE